MVVLNLLVGFTHHHRLNWRQQLRCDQRRNSKSRPEMECRTHIPAKDSATAHATSNAYLATKPLNKIPDLPALEC